MNRISATLFCQREGADSITKTSQNSGPSSIQIRPFLKKMLKVKPLGSKMKLRITLSVSKSKFYHLLFDSVKFENNKKRFKD